MTEDEAIESAVDRLAYLYIKSGETAEQCVVKHKTLLRILTDVVAELTSVRSGSLLGGGR